MKKIYKVLISILVISMLASVGMAAPSPKPTSTTEQVQDQRLTNLEINDTNQNLNNSQQQGQILDLQEFGILLQQRVSNLESSVTSLLRRVTNLENSQSYSATYSKLNFASKRINTTCNQYEEISNLTFNLPVSALVTIESYGDISNYQANDAMAYITIDGGPVSDFWWETSNSGGSNPCYYSCQSTFSILGAANLNQGNHTTRLYAGVCDLSGTSQTAQIFSTTINAIANQKGDLQFNPPNMAKNANSVTIKEIKDGNITIK